MSEAKELIRKICEIQNSDAEIQKIMAGWEGTVQFSLGEEEFYVEYKQDGKCEFKEGKSSFPTFTIIASPELWVNILKGNEDAILAFIIGKYKIQGNILEAQKLARGMKKLRTKYKL
ncbi:MAG: SCP2 sterol-binding domain-containing protein [Archaeoglobaceae archaeon]|nr:SCP2 sterol-binding domain-containing protein [Archaeoglobaceae archaeon]MDW7989544.1 SCP2 sterol-binding domain-containing protein [Archaeoglobaceae archaeon]